MAMEKGSYAFAGTKYPGGRALVCRGSWQSLRRATLIHPEPEEPQPVWRPGFVAGHAPVHQTGIDFGRPSFDLLVRGEIEPVSLHRIQVWTVAEQWPDIDSETCGHGNAPAAVAPLNIECRVALLTSLSFAGLKGWEAIETIPLGTAGIFQPDESSILPHNDTRRTTRMILG